jgi:hypothetical protein
MNDPPFLEPVVANVAALVDERAPLDELDRAWAVLLRLWNAVDRSTPQAAPARELRELPFLVIDFKRAAPFQKGSQVLEHKVRCQPAPHLRAGKGAH